MEKVVKALFIFLLIVFPLGQIGRVELGGGVNILLNDVVVFIVVAVWLSQKVVQSAIHSTSSGQALKVQSAIGMPILLFVITATLSILINVGNLPMSEIFIASLYLVRWIAYAGLYFVVSDFKKAFKEKIPNFLLLSGFATAVLGLVQYILYPDLRNLYYAGWDEHLNRLFSTFLDPNFAGLIFVLTFLLGMYLLGRLGELSRLGRFGVILAVITSFAALLLTYSRGSFISFAVGMAVFLGLIGKKKLLVVFATLFIIGLFLLPKNLEGEGVRLFRTASIEARAQSMTHAVKIFQDNPLFGVGFGAYRYTQVRFGFLTKDEAEKIHSAAGTDNSFLFILATTGIVGLIAYLYLWFRVLGEVREVREKALVVGSLAAIFVHSLFVNSLFYPHVMAWIWILLGGVGVVGEIRVRK